MEALKHSPIWHYKQYRNVMKQNFGFGSNQTQVLVVYANCSTIYATKPVGRIWNPYLLTVKIYTLLHRFYF